MNIVREHINEKFVEDSDPIYDMGIGIVQKGNILKTKLSIRCEDKSSYYCVIADEYKYNSFISKNSIWYVMNVTYFKNDFRMKIKGMDNLEHARSYAALKRDLKTYTKWVPFNIRMPYEQFKKYFEILDENS